MTTTLEKLPVGVFALYTVSATRDYNDGSTTLYAGLSDEEANKVVEKASYFYEDFYKEIWIDGTKVRSYYKAYQNSEWKSEEGSTEDLSVEILAAVNNLEVAVGKLKLTNNIQHMLPIEERLELEELVRKTFGQVHAMADSLEGIRVPK
ncbi:hypothetical protein CHOTACABRAS_235 [Bacillus phage Chotacabras]|nr:hypothetical protein CHOTACABRAS_235 [Bacillus phage Chotacabras]